MNKKLTNHCIRFDKTLHAGIALFLALLLTGVASCSTSRLNARNSFLQPGADDAHIAKIYFIRPMPYKYKGVADNEIQVDLNDEPLLEINEGQYTLVKIKPAKIHVVTHSKTNFTNKTQPIDVSRTREYRFIAGKTYFIHLKRISEEFRGIYYDPAPVSLAEAMKLAEPLRAIGPAKNNPIAGIESVAEVPMPSPLEPAFPEKLYPGTTYLIKGNPKYKAKTVPEGKNEITIDRPPADADKTTP